MEKRNISHERRLKRLVFTCVLVAITLTVSTFAWFVGMKTVNVSPFDVTIAAIDQLSLSLTGNGTDWADTVSINKENHATVFRPEDGNTNSWGGEGLVPMSTIGKIDGTTSRLVLFEKGSFTTTTGGFRLMASRVDNSTAEKRGYVAFDLFVRNLNGPEYYPELNKLNEEAIYLTIDSAVTIPAGGVAGTGIENSVRVAFAQIGRIKATTTDSTIIRGISCNNGNVAPSQGSTATYNSLVTGICADRDAQIWEPNDQRHVANAISWYNTSCKKRTGALVTDPNSYSGDCNTIIDFRAYPTYAVSGVIDYSDNVDVYDGKAYNGYEDTTANDATTGMLVAYDYFTDTEKTLAGTQRPTFMTLAPNSITKIRIYIYIEGQDIDNYDFASLGKRINVAFGFTKERYFDRDIDYKPVTGDDFPTDVQKDLHEIITATE